MEAPLRPWYRPVLPQGERALVRSARRGSADAVEALVRRHWDRAHRTAFLIVHDAAAAEDIAQEAMLAAVHAIDGFDRSRPLGPWLHRIVVNRSLDWLRARKRRNEVSAEAEPAWEAAVDDSITGALPEALRELEPDERALVVMRHVLGYRSSEIAELLGVSPGTVRSRLSRALERLRGLLEEMEES